MPPLPWISCFKHSRNTAVNFCVWILEKNAVNLSLLFITKNTVQPEWSEWLFIL